MNNEIEISKRYYVGPDHRLIVVPVDKAGLILDHDAWVALDGNLTSATEKEAWEQAICRINDRLSSAFRDTEKARAALQAFYKAYHSATKA